MEEDPSAARVNNPQVISRPQGTEDNPLYVKPQPPFEKPKLLYSWQGAIRAFNQKGISYLVVLALVALVVVLVLVFFRQLSLALVVLASAFVLGVYHRVGPPEGNYEIWTTGVKVSERLYLYKDLRSYWIKEEEGVPILHVSTFLSLPYRLTMVINRDQQEKVEEALLKYLPYHEESERDWYSSFNHLVESLVPRVPQRIIDLISSKIPSRFKV